MCEWKCGPVLVLLPDLGEVLSFGATDVHISGLMALGHMEGCLKVMLIFNVQQKLQHTPVGAVGEASQVSAIAVCKVHHCAVGAEICLQNQTSGLVSWRWGRFFLCMCCKT